MLYLLNPRVLITLALVALLAFSHFTVYRKGKAHVRMEWQAAVAASNEDARRLEQARQSAVGSAQRIAAARENSLRAAVARAAGDVRGLRSDLDAALDYAAQSRAAAEQVARVSAGLLERCTAEYLGMAEAAQRSDTEARELRAGWPK